MNAQMLSGSRLTSQAQLCCMKITYHQVPEHVHIHCKKAKSDFVKKMCAASHWHVHRQTS